MRKKEEEAVAGGSDMACMGWNEWEGRVEGFAWLDSWTAKTGYFRTGFIRLVATSNPGRAKA